MRVTILSREFPPAIGGIGDHTDRLATELASRGMRVTVVTSTTAEKRDAFDVRPAIERWDTPGTDRIVRAVAESEPHVVLWQYNPFSIGRHGVAPKAGSLARSLSRIAPLVLYLHELWFPWGRAGARGAVWAAAQRIEGVAVLRAASRWIVTTESRERTLRRMDRSKVVRIPVGTNIEPVGSAEGVRARSAIPDDAFVIVHLGSAGPGRDLRPAFSALEHMRARGIDARLVLAGNTGPVEPPASVRDAVHRTGIVAPDELSHVLAASDVYLHADPVGASAGRRTSLVAAMAHGLPLVAYRGPDSASELVDGRSIVYVERDGRALADVLVRLRGDPDERRSLGAAARAVYDGNFSWTRIGDAVSGVLTSSGR